MESALGPHKSSVGEMEEQAPLAIAITHQLADDSPGFICVSWAEDT